MTEWKRNWLGTLVSAAVILQTIAAPILLASLGTVFFRIDGVGYFTVATLTSAPLMAAFAIWYTLIYGRALRSSAFLLGTNSKQNLHPMKTCLYITMTLFFLRLASDLVAVSFFKVRVTRSAFIQMNVFVTYVGMMMVVAQGIILHGWRQKDHPHATSARLLMPFLCHGKQ